MGIIFKDFLLAQVYLKKATPFESHIQLDVLFKITELEIQGSNL